MTNRPSFIFLPGPFEPGLFPLPRDYECEHILDYAVQYLVTLGTAYESATFLAKRMPDVLSHYRHLLALTEKMRQMEVEQEGVEATVAALHELMAVKEGEVALWQQRYTEILCDYNQLHERQVELEYSLARISPARAEPSPN